jgi:hypothetical protein
MLHLRPCRQEEGTEEEEEQAEGVHRGFLNVWLQAVASLEDS